MDIIEKLAEIFKEFPGIGERQAKRFVYFLMSRTPAYNENLSGLILDLKKEVAQCGECFRFFILNNKKEKLCDICSNVNADSSTLLVVEKDSGSKEPNKLSEIILAFSLSPQGDHTDQYVREQIKDVSEKQTVKISSLGRGLSTGTELKYSDNDTLKNALKNRQ